MTTATAPLRATIEKAQAYDAYAGCAASLGWLLFGLVTTTPLRAFVLRRLWDWFVVRDFGAAPLTWHAALGLLLLLTFGWWRLPKKDEKSDGGAYAWSMSVVFSLFGLGFGWLYHVASRGR